MAHQFFSAALGEATAGGLVELTGTEAKHAATVSRVRVGEQLRVSDGHGVVVVGSVEAASGSSVVVRVAYRLDVPAASPRLTLVQALAKGDRDELAVQAATELGVDAVIPWAAGRSVSRWDESKAIKGRARWQSIVDEASKQSLRAWTPAVAPIHRTKELAELAAAGARILVCVPNAPHSVADVPLDGRDIALVIGPEGGIEPAEIDTLVAAGAEVVRLGSEVLRTSTAGPAAIAVLASRLGRWATDVGSDERTTMKP
ncbi:MAG TPA: 16S rRNA (uracil(1498)-N(3))-methyltransferase [Microbacteriaceae bacterium]|nr:16S rRNA (uracil(1498)-N(3))-methyltransferase [Microbacteriaceae bacterium]